MRVLIALNVGDIIEINKPRVRTPAKNVSTFEINIIYYFLFMGPTLGFDTKQINSFLMFFYNKSKILSILFIVKYEKNHTFFGQFLVLLGPIICMFK